jgi:hypothetical protein
MKNDFADENLKLRLKDKVKDQSQESLDTLFSNLDLKKSTTEIECDWFGSGENPVPTWTENVIESLMAVLHRGAIKKLRLHGCKINNVAAFEAFKGLRGTTVDYLHLAKISTYCSAEERGKIFSKESLSVLGESLCGTMVEKLNLDYNGIGAGAVIALVKVLRNSNVRRLKIKMNNIGLKDLEDLFEALAGTNISYIDIDENEIGFVSPEIAGKLAKLLRATNIIKIVGIQGGENFDEILKGNLEKDVDDFREELFAVKTVGLSPAELDEAAGALDEIFLSWSSRIGRKRALKEYVGLWLNNPELKQLLSHFKYAGELEEDNASELQAALLTNVTVTQAAPVIEPKIISSTTTTPIVEKHIEEAVDFSPNNAPAAQAATDTDSSPSALVAAPSAYNPIAAAESSHKNPATLAGQLELERQKVEQLELRMNDLVQQVAASEQMQKGLSEAQLAVLRKQNEEIDGLRKEWVATKKELKQLHDSSQVEIKQVKQDMSELIEICDRNQAKSEQENEQKLDKLRVDLKNELSRVENVFESDHKSNDERFKLLEVAAGKNKQDLTDIKATFLPEALLAAEEEALRKADKKGNVIKYMEHMGDQFQIFFHGFMLAKAGIVNSVSPAWDVEEPSPLLDIWEGGAEAAKNTGVSVLQGVIEELPFVAIAIKTITALYNHHKLEGQKIDADKIMAGIPTMDDMQLVARRLSITLAKHHLDVLNAMDRCKPKIQGKGFKGKAKQVVAKVVGFFSRYSDPENKLAKDLAERDVKQMLSAVLDPELRAPINSASIEGIMLRGINYNKKERSQGLEKLEDDDINANSDLRRLMLTATRKQNELASGALAQLASAAPGPLTGAASLIHMFLQWLLRLQLL